MFLENRKTPIRRLMPALAATALAMLVAGCANRDSVTVGSIPDDYRTNHPIVVSEKEQTVDVPVAATDRRVTSVQKIAVEGFIAGYDHRAAPPVTILTPVGSANELAANSVAEDMVSLLKRNGISRSRIAISGYQVDAADVSAPIRLSYVAMKAHTNKCGRWTDDLTNTADNKHYTDFGCSYQNNLAAQIANPADLLGPRKPGEIDAERRGIIIDDYRNTIERTTGAAQY